MLASRTVQKSEHASTLPGAPDGDYVVFKFLASFEHKQSAIETLATMKDTDGHWRVIGYFIK